MKRSLTLLIAAALSLGIAVSALALPPIPAQVAEHYAKDPNGVKITETLKVQKGKCGMCHIPDADKKAKGHGLNDFGMAMHDHLKHKEYLAEHKIAADEKTTPADKAAALSKSMAILVDALKKASEHKNAEEKVYGDLIKEGTMPGKNTK